MKKHHAHETDILPPPPRRLEQYVNSPDEAEPEEPVKTKELEHKPAVPLSEHESVIPPQEVKPPLPPPEFKTPFRSPPVMTEVYHDNLHPPDHQPVMESQIPVTPMGKVQEGTYTQLMAVEDISTLNACKIPPQQPYEMYIPMSMQGPSW